MAVRASPGRNGMGQDTRKAMVSTIGMELERELGIQDAHQASILSSLRHPDGASDPHLDQHSGKPYESVRLWYIISLFSVCCHDLLLIPLIFY